MSAAAQSNRSNFYVYALFRETGVPFYIGKGRGDRMVQHEQEAGRGVASRKCNIIRDMHARGFDVVKVKLQEHLTEQVAHAHEVAFIKAIGRGKNGPLINMTDGGEGSSGFKMLPESAAKRGAARRGEKRSEEAIARTAAKHLGMKRSPEALANMAKAAIGRIPHPLATMNAAAATRGKPQSPIHLANRSAALRGIAKSPEHKANLAKANLGKTASADARANMSKAQITRNERVRVEADLLAGQLSLLDVSAS